jgi:hypothetical protein
VAGVADFEKAVAGEGELRLTVQRMTQTRVVKIQRTAGEAPKPAAK